MLQDSKTTKHIGSFWPLFGLVAFTFVVAGLVWLFAFNLNNDYDRSSIFFRSHRTATTALPAKSQPPAKTQLK